MGAEQECRFHALKFHYSINIGMKRIRLFKQCKAGVEVDYKENATVRPKKAYETFIVIIFVHCGISKWRNVALIRS